IKRVRKPENLFLIWIDCQRNSRPVIYTNQFPRCPLNALGREEFALKILVCMKQVPQKDAPLKLNESGTWIREDVSYEVHEPDDYGDAQTGVILAELLGWPHATIIMHIEKNEAGIRVKRELEAGYFQFVDMPLPAVLTIQSGINKLRYATLIGIKQAKNKPFR